MYRCTGANTARWVAPPALGMSGGKRRERKRKSKAASLEDRDGTTEAHVDDEVGGRSKAAAAPLEDRDGTIEAHIDDKAVGRSIHLLKDKYGLKKDGIYSVVRESPSGLHYHVRPPSSNCRMILKSHEDLNWSWADEHATVSHVDPPGDIDSQTDSELDEWKRWTIQLLEKKYGREKGERLVVVGETPVRAGTLAPALLLSPF